MHGLSITGLERRSGTWISSNICLGFGSEEVPGALAKSLMISGCNGFGASIEAQGDGWESTDVV